jgi:ribosomal protein L21E
MNHLSDFTIGDKVILSRVFDEKYKGRTGVVYKLLKGHNMVRVMFSDGKSTTDYYNAYPYNIDKVEK